MRLFTQQILDGFEKHVYIFTFQHDRSHTHFPGFECNFFAGVLCVENDGCLRIRAENLSGGMDAIEDGHREIEDDKVGLQLARHRGGLPAVNSFATNFPARMACEQRSEQVADDGAVVCDENLRDGSSQQGPGGAYAAFIRYAGGGQHVGTVIRVAQYSEFCSVAAVCMKRGGTLLRDAP